MKKLKTFVTGLTLLFSYAGYAQSTKTSVADGDWKNPNVWSPAGVPYLVDTVIINTNITFNTDLDARDAAKKLFLINSGASLKKESSVSNSLILVLGGNTIIAESFINKGQIQSDEIAVGKLIYFTNKGTIQASNHLTIVSDTMNNEQGASIMVGKFIAGSGFTDNKGEIHSTLLFGTFFNSIGGIVNSDSLVGDFTNNGEIQASFLSGGSASFFSNNLEGIIHTNELIALNASNNGEIEVSNYCLLNELINNQ